jgi:hypothetical protein
MKSLAGSSYLNISKKTFLFIITIFPILFLQTESWAYTIAWINPPDGNISTYSYLEDWGSTPQYEHEEDRVDFSFNIVPEYGPVSPLTLIYLTINLQGILVVHTPSSFGDRAKANISVEFSNGLSGWNFSKEEKLNFQGTKVTDVNRSWTTLQNIGNGTFIGNASSSVYLAYQGIAGSRIDSFSIEISALTPPEVAPAPVPVPTTILLLGSGLLSLAGLRRKL